MTELHDRTRSLLERLDLLNLVLTVGGGISITNTQMLDVIVEAAKAEGRQEERDETAAMVITMPQIAPEDIDAFRAQMSKSTLAQRGTLIIAAPDVEIHRAVVMPWTRTAAAQVRDLQAANNRYQQEARDARAALKERRDAYTSDEMVAHLASIRSRIAGLRPVDAVLIADAETRIVALEAALKAKQP